MPQQHSSGRSRGSHSQTHVQYQQQREQHQHQHQHLHQHLHQRRRPREEEKHDDHEDGQQHYEEPGPSAAATATYMDLIRSQQALQLKTIVAEQEHKEEKAQLDEKERELAAAQAKLAELEKQYEDDSETKKALDETLAALRAETLEGRGSATHLKHVVEMAQAEAERKEAKQTAARAAMDADLEREVAELQAKSEELCRQLGIDPEDGRLVARRLGLAVIVCNEAATKEEDARATALANDLNALKEALAELEAEAGAAMDEGEGEGGGEGDAELDQALNDHKAALAGIKQTELEKRAALAGVSVKELWKQGEVAATAEEEVLAMVNAALQGQGQGQQPPQQQSQQQSEGAAAKGKGKGKGKGKKGGKGRKQPTQQQQAPPPPPPVDEGAMCVA